jgi:hypothetical protein
MALPSSTDWPFDPKWFVIGFALGAFALVLGYDLRLGAAVGVAMALIGAFYLYIRFRFAPGPDEPLSERDAMMERFAKLREQRQNAQTKESLSAQERARSGEDT